MSATPVINNLYEAKTLLEMTKGKRLEELKTFSTIANVLAMHEKLMLYGIRRSSQLQDCDLPLAIFALYRSSKLTLPSPTSKQADTFRE